MAKQNKKYLREIQYLKETSSRFSGVPDLILVEIISAFYTYGTVDNIITVRKKSRNTLTFLQSNTYSFDPLNEIGVTNLQLAFNNLNMYLTLEDEENKARVNQAASNPDNFSGNLYGGSGQDINIVGKFKMINEETGKDVTYNINDVVYYDGKTYIATGQVSGCVPSNYAHPECSSWSPIDLPDNKVGYEESGF